MLSFDVVIWFKKYPCWVFLLLLPLAMMVQGGGGGGSSEVAEAGNPHGIVSLPLCTHIPDIAKTVRVGASNVSASELAWPRGAVRDDSIQSIRAAVKHSISTGKGANRKLLRGGSRAGSFFGNRRETWTHTEVIEGLSESQPFTERNLLQRSLFLGGTGDLVEKDLWNYLQAEFGNVEDVEVIRHFDTPRGFALATFVDSKTAQEVLVAGSLHLNGHVVRVLPWDQDAHPASRKGPVIATHKTQKGFATPSNKVFLGGTRQLREEALLPMLERFGDVTSLHVILRHDNSSASAGFAFASFASVEEARRLVKKGSITVANVTLQATFAAPFDADKARACVSEKVSLGEAEELERGLIAEIQRVVAHAPGGYVSHAAVVREGIVFAAGTPFEQVFTQRFSARREALDEAGRTVSELEAMLHEARTLRTQVYDCLGSRLRQAAEHDDAAQVRELAAGGADVNAPQRELSMQGGDDSGGVYTLGRYDEYSPRALYLAAAQGHVDMCRLLLELNATIDVVCRGQELETLGSFVAYTPLKVAAERGLIEVVQVLLVHGADVNFTDDSGWCIVHWAACNNHADVVRALGAAGADLNAVNLHGRSPLALALAAGAHEAAAALRELGARVIEKARFGKKKKP